MISYATHHRLFWVSSAIVFLLFTLLLSGEPESMFGDSDMLWHIAAGDLIRQLGAIPVTDPWSYTAGDYRWINVAWLWDVVFSYFYEHFGWHGPVVLNATIVSLTITVLFAHGLLRSSHNLIPIVLALVGAILMISIILRPLQITMLMTAVWMLILGQFVRNQCRASWLLLFPVLMVIWANCHGGFIVGLMALAFFFIEAALSKNFHHAKWLFLVGAACFAASFINPYGWRLYELQWIVANAPSLTHVDEWQPVKLSYGSLLLNLLAVVFILLVPRNHTLPFTKAER